MPFGSELMGASDWLGLAPLLSVPFNFGMAAYHGYEAVSHYGDGTDASSDNAGEAALDLAQAIPGVGTLLGLGRKAFDHRERLGYEAGPSLGHYVLGDPNPDRFDDIAAPRAPLPAAPSAAPAPLPSTPPSFTPIGSREADPVAERWKPVEFRP